MSLLFKRCDRSMALAIQAALCLAVGLGPASLLAQSQPKAPPAQSAPQSPPAKPPTDANPFPTDTSNVPILPNAETPAAVGNAPADSSAPAHVPGEDSDPVRSPDQPIGEPDTSSQGFSSSSAGLDRMPQPDNADEKPNRKHGREEPAAAPHLETAQEDENVGAYYLSEKNWRAALSRYQSALVLDPENPDVYWGLAESQRHLGDLAHAKENYTRVMEYDPDSKHAKEAKKLLAEPEMAHATAAPAQQPAK